MRQIASFADTAASRPFPRLFIIDLYYDSSSKKSPLVVTGSRLTRNMSLNSGSAEAGTSQISSSSVEHKGVKFCIRAMCECESGWHPAENLIEYEQLMSIPQTHYAYLYRIMNLLKITSLDLDILSNSNKLDELIEYIEDHLPNNADDVSAANTSNMMSSMMSSQMTYQRMRNTENIFSFKESYNSLKSYLTNALDNLEPNVTPSVMNNRSRVAASGPSTDINNPKKANLINLNRVEHFKLNRCSMPSGKIVWLCDEHSREEHVQVLTSTQEKKFTQYQNDEFNTILFEELKKLEPNAKSGSGSISNSNARSDKNASVRQVATFDFGLSSEKKAEET